MMAIRTNIRNILTAYAEPMTSSGRHTLDTTIEDLLDLFTGGKTPAPEGDGSFEGPQHCEEWCDPDEREDGVKHGAVCPDAPFSPEAYTKGQFVAGAMVNAAWAVDNYLFWITQEGYDPKSAREAVIAEAEESAVCFAGIGSCGRGWCNHS